MFRFLNFSAYYICKVKNPKKLSAFQMVTSFLMIIKLICIYLLFCGYMYVIPSVLHERHWFGKAGHNGLASIRLLL